MHWIIFILIVFAWFIFTKSSSHETRVPFNAPGRFRKNVQSPQASLELPPSVTTTANNIFPSPFIANIYNGLGIYPHLPSTFQAYVPYFQLQPFIVVALSNKETAALQSALSNQQIIIPQLSQTYFCGWGICPNSQSQSLHQNNIGSNSIESSLNSKTMSNPQQFLQNNTIDFLLPNQPDSQIILNQNANKNESIKNELVSQTWAQQNPSTKIPQDAEFNTQLNLPFHSVSSLNQNNQQSLQTNMHKFLIPQLNLSSNLVATLNQNKQQFSNQQSLQTNTHNFLLPNQPDSQILLNQKTNINSDSNKNQREPQPWTQQNYNSPTKIQQNPQLNSQLNFPSISVSSLNQNYQQSSNQQSTNNILHPNHQPVTYSNSKMNQQNLTTQVSQNPSNSLSKLEQSSNFQPNQYLWGSISSHHNSPSNQQTSNSNSQNYLPLSPQENFQTITPSSSLSNLEQTSNFQSNQHLWGSSSENNSPSNQQTSNSNSQKYLPLRPQENSQANTPSGSLPDLEQTSNFHTNQHAWGSIFQYPSLNQQTSNLNSHNYLLLRPQNNSQTNTSFSFSNLEPTSNFQSNQHLWGSSSHNNSPLNQQTSKSNSQNYIPLNSQENFQANTPPGSLPDLEKTSNFLANQHLWGPSFHNHSPSNPQQNTLLQN